MKAKLEQIRLSALEQLEAVTTKEELEAFRVKMLGKKGELTAVLRGMGQLTAEERPVIGQLANEIRAIIEEKLEARSKELEGAALGAKLREEKLDITMPGVAPKMGKRHPLAKVEAEMADIFRSMGFDIVEGPEVENDY